MKASSLRNILCFAVLNMFWIGSVVKAEGDTAFQNPFVDRAPASQWSGSATHQNGMVFRILIFKNGKRVTAEYPGTKCGSILKLLRHEGKTAIFKEVARPGFKNCNDGRTITLTRRFLNSVVFSWGNKDNAVSGRLGRLTASGKSVFEVVQAPARKTFRNINKTGPSLQGTWQGVAACRRRTQEISAEFFYKNGVNRGFIKSSRRKIKTELVPQGSRSFRLLTRKKNRVKLSRLRGGSDLPRYLDLKFPGQCRNVFLIRHEPIENLGGQYAQVTTQKEFCRMITKKWLGVARAQRGLARTLKYRYFSKSDEYSSERAIKVAIFAPDVFTKFFGRPAHEINDKTYTQLENQIKGCLATYDYFRLNEIYTGINLFTPDSIRKTVTEIGSKGIFTGVNFVETREYRRFKKSRTNSRLSAEQIMGNWKSLLVTENPLQKLQKHIKAKAAQLAEASPEDVEQTLAKIVGAVRGVTHEMQGFAAALAKRKRSVMENDRLPGYMIVSAPFGHYIYVKQDAVTALNCKSVVPIRVRLSSQVLLNHLDNRGYGKSFFFYAFRTLARACDKIAKTNSVRALQVSYFFDGKRVAEALVRPNGRNVRVSNIKLLIKPGVHPRAHIGFLFDSAAAAVLDISTAPFGINFPKFTLNNLRSLANRGDMQALTVLGFAKVLKLGKGNSRRNSANALLIYSLERGQKLNQQAMQKASNAGSVVASFILAHDLAIKKGWLDYDFKLGSTVDEASAQEKANFIHWYAKARAGNGFWYRYLDPVARQWDKSVNVAILKISKSGFIGPPPQKGLVRNPGDTSEKSVQDLLAPKIVSRLPKLIFDGSGPATIPDSDLSFLAGKYGKNFTNLIERGIKNNDVKALKELVAIYSMLRNRKGLNRYSRLRLIARWTAQAARQGDKQSIVELGAMVDSGQGVLPNREKAVEIFQYARDKGYKGALPILDRYIAKFKSRKLKVHQREVELRVSRNARPSRRAVTKLVAGEVMDIMCTKNNQVRGAAQSGSIWNMIIALSPDSMRRDGDRCIFKHLAGTYVLRVIKVSSISCSKAGSKYDCSFGFSIKFFGPGMDAYETLFRFSKFVQPATASFSTRKGKLYEFWVISNFKMLGR